MQGSAARQFTPLHVQIEGYERQREAEEERRQLADSVSLDDLAIFNPAIYIGKQPPRREWMVENCFLKGTVALVSGDGGIGKSLLMQQLLTCAATENRWLGKEVMPGRGLMLACEDDVDELWRRQVAINRHLGVDMSDLARGDQDRALRLQVWPRTGQDNALMYLERSTWRMTPTDLLKRIQARCIRDAITYLVIDTATQTFRGNQNDETQVMDYITELRQLALRIQGVVIVTKHPSMSGRALGTGESGNVSWRNSVRSMFYMHKDKGTGQLLFEGRKSNYGPQDQKTAIKWREGVYVVDEPELPGYGDAYWQS
jgi:RecA-family ATPase